MVQLIGKERRWLSVDMASHFSLKGGSGWLEFGGCPTFRGFRNVGYNARPALAPDAHAH